jgi:hypothetical protein
VFVDLVQRAAAEPAEPESQRSDVAPAPGRRRS